MLKFKFFNALTILVVLLQAVMPIPALAMVGTNLPDYAPGSFVTFSGDNSDGAGYVAETVHVNVSGPNGFTAFCDAAADDTGAWSCQIQLGADVSDGNYSYTATGQTSGVVQSGGFTVTTPPPATPVVAPTQEPTQQPTVEPTQAPTEAPTLEPTQAPTEAPTTQVTDVPTTQPTVEPTTAPTQEPTAAPTQESAAPTVAVTPAGPPFIQSDKEDYAPAELVTLTSGNWLPGEWVVVYVNDNIGQTWSITTNKQADANGAFTYQFSLPNWFVATYAVVAQGEVSGTVTTTFTDATNTTTAVTRTAGVSPSTYGDSITFTATVTQQGNNHPITTGNVEFRDGANCASTLLQSATTVDSNGNVTFTTSTLTAGPHTIRACYLGSGSGGNAIRPSDNNISQTVNKATLTVTADNTSRAYGDANPTFTATFTGFVNGQTLGTSGVTGSPSLTTSATATSSVSGSPYAITAALGSLASNNYSFSFANGQLTITQAHLTVTADNKGRAYGTANPTFTATLSGFKNGQTLGTSGVTGSANCSSTATPASSVSGSPYAITCTIGTLAAGNYDFTPFVSGQLTIGTADQTITFGALTDKTYGDADFGVSATASSGLAVTFTATGNCTVSSSMVHIVGAGSCTVTAHQSGDSNYNAASDVGRSFNIGQKDATVSADHKTKIYGDENPELTATVEGTVNDDTLNYTLATTALKFSNVGNYPITVTLGSNPNYNVTKIDDTLSIGQKDATVSADHKTKIYGDDNPELTATVEGTVNGDTLNYSLATTASKFSNVGDYTITVTIGSNPNYNVTPTDDTLHISQKDATVKADNKTKTYGDANPALTATVTGEVVGGDAINYMLATTATQFSNIGDYTIAVTLGSNSNYNVTPTNGNLHIGPKAATIKADNKSKTYGDDNPALTATVDGTVNGDTLNFTLATDAVKFSGVGDYPITVTLASNPNYDVTPANGNLHIGPKTATVKADNKSKTYGDDNPALTATVGGTVNGDTLNFTLATDAVKFSGVGDYLITVTIGTNPNYNITPTNGNLHVDPKAATVKAEDKTKTYGDNNPTLTATVTGQVAGGDTIQYSLSTSATQFSDIGDYTIVVTLGTNPNYTVTPTDGNLHINAKDATVTANPKAKTYGDDNPTLTATVVGEVSGGDVIQYTLDTTAVKFSGVGSYPITVTLGTNPNYNVTKTDDTLQVAPKSATVTANNKSKTYGDDNPVLDAVVTGTVNGDVLNYTLSTTALKYSGIGDYVIAVALGSNPNYAVTPTNSTLHINPKAATVIADAKSKTYGDDNPALTATVTGQVVGGDMINYTLATTAVKLSGVGDYPITVTLGLNPNYTVTPTNGTLHIDPKAATVVADAKSKTYGDDNPALTAVVTGQVIGGDTINYTLTTTAVNLSGVGDYPIVVTLGSNPNYIVTPTNSTLHINAKDATVTADNKTKTYGADNPGLTATVTGQVPGGDAINYSLSTTAVKLSPVGTYPITVTLGSNPNYIVTSTDGTLTVGQATTTITVISSKNPSTLKEPVTFTATIYPQLAGMPTGTVTFKDGSTILGTGTLNSSGVATFTTSSLAIGSHSITAVYNGDTNFTGSTTSVLTQKVQYRFDGFLQPINDTAHSQICGASCPISIFKAGSTVPVKFQLKDFNGNVVQSATLPQWLTPVKGSATTSTVDEITYTDAPTPGGTYRWSGSPDSQYIYNWGTSKGGAGNYWRIGVMLDDGTTYFVNIGLR